LKVCEQGTEFSIVLLNKYLRTIEILFVTDDTRALSTSNLHIVNPKAEVGPVDLFSDHVFFVAMAFFHNLVEESGSVTVFN